MGFVIHPDVMVRSGVFEHNGVFEHSGVYEQSGVFEHNGVFVNWCICAQCTMGVRKGHVGKVLFNLIKWK